MRQQVNLYQPIFRREKRVFSALAMLYAVLAVISGLTVVYGYGAWQVRDLAGRVERLAAQRDAAQTRLVGLEGKVPTRRPSRLLETELARIGAELARKSEVLSALDSGAIGNFAGLSPFMEGLARQRVDGLWVRRLEVSEGGRSLAIDGSALEPELVPALVQRLGRERVYSGLSFRNLKMKRLPATPAQVDFALQTASGEG